MTLIWCKEPLCRYWSLGFDKSHEHNPERPKLGEFTGLVDKLGVRIYEGDILEEYLNQFYGEAPVVVRWAPARGAWSTRGEYLGGGAHESLNGEDFKSCKRIGNIDFDRKLYAPAVKLDEKKKKRA